MSPNRSPELSHCVTQPTLPSPPKHPHPQGAHSEGGLGEAFENTPSSSLSEDVRDFDNIKAGDFATTNIFILVCFRQCRGRVIQRQITINPLWLFSRIILSISDKL